MRSMDWNSEMSGNNRTPPSPDSPRGLQEKTHYSESISSLESIEQRNCGEVTTTVLQDENSNFMNDSAVQDAVDARHETVEEVANDNSNAQIETNSSDAILQNLAPSVSNTESTSNDFKSGASSAGIELNMARQIEPQPAEHQAQRARKGQPGASKKKSGSKGRRRTKSEDNEIPAALKSLRRRPRSGFPQRRSVIGCYSVYPPDDTPTQRRTQLWAQQLEDDGHTGSDVSTNSRMFQTQETERVLSHSRATTDLCSSQAAEGSSETPAADLPCPSADDPTQESSLNTSHESEGNSQTEANLCNLLERARLFSEGIICDEEANCDIVSPSSPRRFSFDISENVMPSSLPRESPTEGNELTFWATGASPPPISPTVLSTNVTSQTPRRRGAREASVSPLQVPTSPNSQTLPSPTAQSPPNVPSSSFTLPSMLSDGSSLVFPPQNSQSLFAACSRNSHQGGKGRRRSAPAHCSDIPAALQSLRRKPRSGFKQRSSILHRSQVGPQIESSTSATQPRAPAIQPSQASETRRASEPAEVQQEQSQTPPTDVAAGTDGENPRPATTTTTTARVDIPAALQSLRRHPRSGFRQRASILSVLDRIPGQGQGRANREGRAEDQAPGRSGTSQEADGEVAVARLPALPADGRTSPPPPYEDVFFNPTGEGNTTCHEVSAVFYPFTRLPTYDDVLRLSEDSPPPYEEQTTDFG